MLKNALTSRTSFCGRYTKDHSFFFLIHMLCVFHSVDSLNVHWVKYFGKTAWISITRGAQKPEKERLGIWHLKGNNVFVHVQFTLSSFSVTIYFIYLTNKNHHYDNNYIKWCIGSVWWRGGGSGEANSGNSRSHYFTDLHPEVTWID